MGTVVLEQQYKIKSACSQLLDSTNRVFSLHHLASLRSRDFAFGRVLLRVILGI